MKGIKFLQDVPKFLFRKIRLNSKFALVTYREDWNDPEIKYPNQIIVKSRMTGICGSDLHQILGEMSIFSSIMVPPKVKYLPLGHEIVGEVFELSDSVNSKFEIGDRVIVNPISHCEAIGFELCDACKKGEWQYCKTIVGHGDGSLLAESLGDSNHFRGFGLHGFCELFLAYEKQLYKIPSELPDKIAVMAEPLAVAIQAVYKHPPSNNDQILVIGAGIIGLMTILAIRAQNSNCKIIVGAKYPFQADNALLLGANHVIVNKKGESLTNEIDSIIPGLYAAPAIGRRANYGINGISRVYDSIGSERSILDAIHMITTGGEIVIIGLGLAKAKKIDWSMIIFKEIRISGSYVYGMIPSSPNPIDPFEEALKILKNRAEFLKNFVTRTYPIEEYKSGFSNAMQKGKLHTVKTAFKWI